jgi:undecaprenyl-diphosphatase
MIERLAAWSERERAMALWLHAASSSWAPVVRLLRGVSRLSDGWLWLGIGCALPWFGGQRGLECAWQMLVVGFVDLLLYLVIKRHVARPRPYRCCPGVEARIPSLDEFSFPSGHALHAVAFSVIVTGYYPHAGYALWPFVGLVALSRVVLGLHFLSDVLVGAAIGALTATISFNLM